MKNEHASILIAGDLCPIGRSAEPFTSGDSDRILGEFASVFSAADIAIANLEAPLLRFESEATKQGPNLGIPLSAVRGIKAIGLTAVGLANNHIMDHGEPGLESTLEILNESGVSHFGAGSTIATANDVYIKTVRNLRIGFIAFAEHEFGIASSDVAGANPLDVTNFVRLVEKRKSDFDVLIVLVHGGNEHFLYPRPDLRNTCQFLVEQGATAVICQHSHCSGCIEEYKNGVIIYGQGNFIFDMPSTSKEWSRGMLVTLDVSSEGLCSTKLIPYRQCKSKDRSLIHDLPQRERDLWLAEFNQRSLDLLDPIVMKTKWSSFCESQKRYYLNSLGGRPSLLRRVLGKLDLLHLIDSNKTRLRQLNIVRCESHREALVEILENELRR